MTRYRRRFGGTGTIVTLADGCACTAAHCVAAVDGRRGVWIAGGGRAWRVERRWLPSGRDLVVLMAAHPPSRRARVAWPRGRVLRQGLVVSVSVWNGQRFVRRRAIVRTVARHACEAEFIGRVRVRPGDSGGAVLSGATLVGVLTHHLGAADATGATASIRVARVDTPEVRAVLTRLRRRPA